MGIAIQRTCKWAHSPQQRWVEQSNHLKDKLLIQALLGGSSVMEHCRVSCTESGGYFTFQQRK